MSSKFRTHLVIGDSHSKPGVSNNRYTLLGRMIEDIRPGVVVDIGDWWDMESLSSYDRGKRSFEGRRYRKDIEAGIDAMKRVENELSYTPFKYRCLGNHENRIEKATHDSPELEGLMSTDDLCSIEYGWKQHDYKEPVLIDGIAYCHEFASGIMGKPIGGENPCSNLLNKKKMSCVIGHNHILDFSTRNNAIGKEISAVSSGCFFEHKEDYAGPQVNAMWNRGIVVLNDVYDGMFDFEWWSIDRIKRKYGRKTNKK